MSMPVVLFKDKKANAGCLVALLSAACVFVSLACLPVTFVILWGEADRYSGSSVEPNRWSEYLFTGNVSLLGLALVLFIISGAASVVFWYAAKNKKESA